MAYSATIVLLLQHSPILVDIYMVHVVKGDTQFTYVLGLPRLLKIDFFAEFQTCSTLFLVSVENCFVSYTVATSDADDATGAVTFAGVHNFGSIFIF